MFLKKLPNGEFASITGQQDPGEGILSLERNWIISLTAQQGGTDQPAAAPESKAEGDEKTKPESEERPQ